MKLNPWRWSFVFVFLAASAWAQAPACVPDCRSGYVCYQGQCVSRCNPPCAAGTTCLENGECSAAPAYLAPSASAVGPRVNRGWATGAGVMGAVSAGVILVLTGVTIALNGDSSANYSAAVAILFTGVSIPIVAVGSGSGRWDPRITGSPAWRIVGWVSFGLAMANAVVALGVGISGAVFPSYGIASLGALATLSALSHMADAFITAGQGRELQEEPRAGAPGVKGLPLFSLAPNGRGGVTPTVGWALVF